MEQKDIFLFIEKFEQSRLTRMEIRDGDFSLKLENQPAVPAAVAPAAQVSTALAAAEQNTGSETAAPASDHLVAIRAPLVGVFYAAPAPDQPPYVKTGDKVKAGDTIGGVGETAWSECAEATHLHFELYEKGSPVDPTSYFEK